jgi:tetratricopeptide (TPR) repeat protein
MAKKKNQETRTKLEEINDSLSGIEQKFEQHKNIIYWSVMAVLIIALIIWAYFKFIYTPNLEKANAELAKADTELIMKQDSVAALKAYEKVAKNYSNEAGNVAKLKAATILYAQGQIKKALNYLEDYSPKGKIVAPSSQSLLGDCYVNTKQLDKAVAAYDKAIKLAGDNKAFLPSLMLKKANVLHSLKKYNEELDIYEEIENNYYGPGALDAQIERAKALGAK